MRMPTQKKWHVFALVATGVFMTTLDSSIVNIALPTIMTDLGAAFETVQWVVVIYLLTISATLLTFGRLSDITGRRWVYCCGFIAFSVGSLCCGSSFQSFWLILSRVLQGIGAAMIMACSPALVVDAFPQRERGKALGFVGAVVSTGLISGPFLGGLILQFFHWRVIFLLNIPIGIVAVLAGCRLLQGTASDVASRESFDWPGAVWLAVALFSLMTFMLHAGEWGVFSIPMIALAGTTLIGTALLVRSGYRSAHPLIDRQLLRNRFFMVSVACAVILFAGLFTITFLMPFYLMRPAGLGPRATGMVMMTPFVFLFFISPLSGSLCDRFGSRLLCFVGMGALTAALLAFTTLMPSPRLFGEMWRLALAGIGIALFLPAYNASAMNAIPAGKRGIASGTVAAARNFGMVIGVALSGLIFNHTFVRLSQGSDPNVYHPALRPVFLQAFHAAMLAGALLVGIGWVLTLLRGKPDNPAA